MQVKKFEAKTMQDALAMVKKHLGPEAIILAAKDNKGSFGLGGESSVEVTAAVSAHKLKEHQFAMSRLRSEDQEKILQSPAQYQKKFVEKSVKRFVPEEPQSNITSRQYITISDEEEVMEEERRAYAQAPAKQVSASTYQQQGNLARVRAAMNASELDFKGEAQEEPATSSETSERVKAATKNALAAFSKEWDEEVVEEQTKQVAPSPSANPEVEDLKKQIAQLHKVISSFKEVPQKIIGTHPGAEFEIPYELSENFAFLVRKGVSEELSASIIKSVMQKIERPKWKKKGVVQAVVARHILEDIKVKTEIENGVHVFVGTSGSGKTSSLIKLAARLVVNERKKVAILTTDTMKVGASEQLKVYAKILNVPFGVVRSAGDWDRVLKALSDIDCVLVDTPGVALRNLEEIEAVKASIPENFNHHTHVHLVQAVTMKNEDAQKYAEKFKVFDFEDIVFTKLDESVQHGLIYNQSKHFKLPLLGFGVGANIPEDFEFASAERLVDLLFDLSGRRES